MESAFLSWLRQRVPTADRAPLGLSDDAAILTWGSSQCVLTTDMLMDGVDFELHRCDARLVGRKALAVNLSDLAAMAATPLAAFISVALPRRDGSRLGQLIYEGLLDLAEKYDVCVAGGDTNSWGGPLAISVAVVGTTSESGPLLRSGARPGDAILVTGEFGGSILERHFSFEPRVREAIQLVRDYRLHAGMDVSDGLSLDLSRMASESGCGALLDTTAIPVSRAARALAGRDDDQSALDHALGDGEDFELLLAVPADEADHLIRRQPLDVKLSRIGRFVEEAGIWSGEPDGTRRRLRPRGYEHTMD